MTLDNRKTEQKMQDAITLHKKAVLRKTSSTVLTILIYTLIVIVFLTPLIYVFGNSVRNSQAIWTNAYPISWKTFVPYEGMIFDNYAKSLGLTGEGQYQGMDISRNLWISLSTSILVVCSSIIFNTGAAYFFGRLKFPGKKYLLVYVLATMMIPQQVVIIPLYLVVDQLGLIDTFWALIIPWYASPFIVFLLTQYMADLPYEFDEAATIDGANQWQILWKVVIPNVIPGLITVSLMEFQFIWNEYYWPLVAISNKNLFPVQVAIASQFTEAGPNWGVVFAAMVLASAPVIILFLLMQRYFFESTALSGVKG